MLVLEGKNGKSVVLSEMVNMLSNVGNRHEIHVIDYVGIPHMFDYVTYCSNGDELKLENFIEDYRKFYESFNSAKILVLSLNAPIYMLNELKQLEKDFNKNIIVTIQNDKMDEVKIFNY